MPTPEALSGTQGEQGQLPLVAEAGLGSLATALSRADEFEGRGPLTQAELDEYHTLSRDLVSAGGRANMPTEPLARLIHLDRRTTQFLP